MVECNCCLWALYILSSLTVFRFLSYAIPHLMCVLRSPVNLKKKYDAEWALVTGGSSGIGRALAEKLATQGLNIVIASLDDDLLRNTQEEMSEAFPELEIRTVGVNMSPGQDYMTPIIEATEDIDVQCIFNNAGYIVTGFFDQSPVERQLANMECNATAAVKITHHFLKEMLDRDLKGCIVYTSSAAAFMPSAFSVMYGSTKAFLSQMAASLSVEVMGKGIDVLACHPSPVASRFYENTHKLDALALAQAFAVPPEQLPDEILRSVGRLVWRDIGGFSVGLRVGMSAICYNLASTVFAMGAPFSGDYKKYSKQD